MNFAVENDGRRATRWHDAVNRIRRTAGVSALLCTGLLGLGQADDAAALSDLEKRGEYLAAAGNCVSCHSSERGRPFAGGLEFVTPFGTIYSTNITSDPETGIGAWTLDEFRNAMRRGERPDGEHLYPVFPYTSFAKISDADIEALYAFLRTLAPVKYTPPENDLGFPFNQRWTLGLWKSLYLDETPFAADPSQSTAWNRGAYLVQGLGHCGECHTPRNFLGAADTEFALTGASYLERVEGKLSTWSAANLTGASDGLAMWSNEDIADYLKLGFSHRAGVFGPMNKVVVNSTRHLTDDDIAAMTLYLKSLPGKSRGQDAPAADDVLRMGSVQYDIHCGTCHLPTGEGSPETGPPVLGSPVVLDRDPASLINITLYGAQLPRVAPSPEWQARGWKRMEPYASKLSDEQAAALLSYIRSAWGHNAGAVTPAQVAAQR
jgi:mono/diheme cytochrome c family protein